MQIDLRSEGWRGHGTTGRGTCLAARFEDDPYPCLKGLSGWMLFDESVIAIWLATLAIRLTVAYWYITVLVAWVALFWLVGGY